MSLFVCLFFNVRAEFIYPLTHSSFYLFTNCSTEQLIKQPAIQMTKQTITQSNNLPTSHSTKQPINQPVTELTNRVTQMIDQSINQTITHPSDQSHQGIRPVNQPNNYSPKRQISQMNSTNQDSTAFQLQTFL